MSLVCATASLSQSTQRRLYGDTPVIRSWIRMYNCPASATRLPPIRVSPDGHFTKAEACAVAWRARADWIRSPRLAGTVISPSDSLSITEILVSHEHGLIVPQGGEEKDARPISGFLVQLYRGGKLSVVVGFGRNKDFSGIGWGHPKPPKSPT